jgi:hypothetical protein
LIINFLINGILILLAVVIHYEALYRLSKSIPRLNIRYRFRVLYGVLGTLVAHVLEVWMFAVAYFAWHHSSLNGGLQGNYDGSLLDSAYFSLTTYTTVGYGDIQPTGDLRFLAGLEGLTGLVLITWSASFLFIEMQKFWNSSAD